MKKLALFVFSLLALSCSSGNGWVRVEGNKFIDPKGKEIIFRGLCFSDPVKLVREGHWNEEYFAEAAEWGANIVRFAVHPGHINSLGWDETFAEMDKGVEYAKKYGLYIIMDWHSIGNLVNEKFTAKYYETTKEETIRFWKTVAERYKDEPQVAMYELFNEPTINGQCAGATWTQWKELQEQIIDEIRAINPHALCLCACFDWAYDLKPIATEPVRRENIAYVSHPYPMKRRQPWEGQWEKDFGYVADTYPVICTEIGFCLENEKGAHVPVKSTVDYGNRITKYFEEKGISFTVWCFDPQWAPMLFSDWDFTPTTQGRFFKTYLQSKKAGLKEPARPPIIGLAHAAFFTKDMESTRSFFKDYFGYDEPIVMKNDDGSLAFTVIKINDRQLVELFPEREQMTPRLYHFALETTDAEAMRLYLKSKGCEVPDQTPRGRTGNLNYFVKDPNGNICEIVEYGKDGMNAKDIGQHLPKTRIAPRMSHVGIPTPDLDKALSFYVDILGFREVWRGGPDPAKVNWVHVQTPEGEETLELMLYEKKPSWGSMGSMNHICLEVSDIEAAKAELDSRTLPEGLRQPSDIRTGINRKRQVNCYNIEGTRVERMEDHTVDGVPAPSSTGVPMKYVPEQQ